MAHATIRDVAREAEVSVASVSRVLNGHTNVRPALRDRIEAVAARLGYIPHAGARNLSMARTNAIGVMLPDIHGEFFSETIRGMDREASARGLQLLLSNFHADQHRAVEGLRTMRGRVDGLILMVPDIDPDKLFAHLHASIPAVLINCAPHDQPRPELKVDNVAAAAAMVDHLVATGRRRIVHLSGPLANIEAADRLRGYEAALARHGLPARVIQGDFLEEAGTAAAAEILRDPESVDALFAANDMMAIGALVALRRGGVDVPGRMAIAGFDDIPLARLISPALTTMRPGMAEIGARAVARLVAAIEGRAADGPEVEWRVPELVVRESSVSDSSITSTRTRQAGSTGE